MFVRKLSPVVLEHQMRLILELADRKNWNSVQRLFVAGVLVFGAVRRAVRSKRRGYHYNSEAAAYRRQMETLKAAMMREPKW